MKRAPKLISACCVIVACLAGNASVSIAQPAGRLAEERPVVRVKNAEELYAAVNNAAHADTTVVLASGTYTLTTTDPNNEARPNGGRIVLPSGMVLVGHNQYLDFDGDGIWDPRDGDHDAVPDSDPVRGLIFADPDSETIIDAVNLSGTAGAVRAGLYNRIAKITLRNTKGLLAAIDVNMVPPSGGSWAEIRDCLLEDGQRGIRLPTVRQDGLHSSALLERNISRRHLGTFGFGVQIVHIGPSTNSSWDVIMRNNLVYGNRVGLFVVAEGSANVQSHVFSIGNVYQQNELGLNIHVGRDNFPVQPLGGNGNYTHFTSVEDRILSNSGTSGPGGLGGGVIAIAGLVTDEKADPSSNDVLDLQFIGTRWLGNVQGKRPQDLQVYGSLAVGGMPGTNDRVRVFIRGATSDAGPEAFRFIGGQPGDSTNTDAVILTDLDVRFVQQLR